MVGRAGRDAGRTGSAAPVALAPLTVRDCLARGRPTLSFEFMPPRPENEDRTWRVIEELAALGPDFVSVTYGAGGSTRDNTAAAVERLAARTPLLPVAHLTAVGDSLTDLRHIADRFAGAGVRDVLALRGDPPGNVTGPWRRHPEGVEYASELVELLAADGRFCVGVAAFPSGHPRSSSVESDTRWFVAKCRAGADYAITQMVFDAEDYLRLRDRVAAAGCETPIIAGIMPVTTLTTIERSQQLSGAPFPAWLRRRFEAVAGDADAVRRLGIEEAARLVERLVGEGAPGIHVITMNSARAAARVVSAAPALRRGSGADR